MTQPNIQNTSLLFFLSLVGIAGNYLSLPLFFGVDFIFGSVAVLITIRLLNVTAAVMVAIIAGSYTFWLWGHPYALIIFATEAFIVGYLFNRRLPNLIIADIVFWVFLGMPMIWVSYKGIMHLPDNTSILIMLKQPINGISNAILATLALMFTPVIFQRTTAKSDKIQINLNELLFTTLLSLTFFSSLLLVIFQHHHERNIYESSLAQEMETNLHNIVSKLNYARDEKELVELAGEIKQTMQNYEMLIFLKNKKVASTLNTKSNQSILSKGTHKQTNSDISVWLPERNNQPFIKWWRQAYYYKTGTANPIGPVTVYILHSSNNIIDVIQKDTTTGFIVLFGIILMTGLLSFAISNLLSRGIIQLARATKDLPEKLQKGELIDWPKSRVDELHQLSIQTEIMANNISESFNDINIRSRTIIESSMDAIITFNDSGVISSFNNAAEKMFGYSQIDIIGSHIKRLIPDHGLVLTRTPLPGNSSHNDKNNLTSRFETIAAHKNNNTFPIELSVSKIQLNNELIYTVIISDITERKQNEKLKQDFISTVSHELRTPLTSIRGSVKLILNLGEKNDIQNTNKLIEIMDRNVDRLNELIDDLLDIEKLSNGGIEYEIEKISIQNVIDDIMKDNQTLAIQHNIELSSVHNNSDYVHADTFRLSQILTNFLSNAIKFSETGSSVYIGCENKGQSVKIYVKDKGRGIPEHFRDRIFTRFSQAESSDDKRVQRGTGLGLAISKKLTEDMGGIIGFESIENQGSTFYVIFPQANGQSAKQAV